MNIDLGMELRENGSHQRNGSQTAGACVIIYAPSTGVRLLATLFAELRVVETKRDVGQVEVGGCGEGWYFGSAYRSD